MLEHLSPREFEEYCQALLMCHFNCVVQLTPPSGDGGRDLLVRHPYGLIVVECKHYPTGVVGRPVVQKLHSAVLTENTNQGMIITTGRFSGEATELVRNLQDVRIELVDATKLAHLISTTFSPGVVPLNLCAAIQTTPDADFSQIFAWSIFAATRYNKGSRFTGPVRVNIQRVTRYLAYYSAGFQAEGELKSAVGTFRRSWEGSLWVRADGREAGFGSPRLNGAELAPLRPLSEVLITVHGPTDAPKLQPHQAVAKMREFAISNCAKVIHYQGRNKVTYSRQITPARNKVDIHSLLLCYIPEQEFVLQVGNICHQGRVEEQDSPPAFIVKCPSLSECTVCGTATSATNQILCCVCFSPAHRWSLFFPDSFECKSCGGLVCRKHMVRSRGRFVCARCDPAGKALPPRWLPHCLFGTVVSALFAVIAIFLSGYPLAIPIVFVIASWIPMLGMVLQGWVRRKNYDLIFKKE